MKRELSLRGDTFADAAELFDMKLNDVLGALIRQGLTDGTVTLGVDVSLSPFHEQDEDGIYHDFDEAFFSYNVSSTVTQKSKAGGEVADRLKLRVVNGQLELRDLDENTIFDMVEGGVNDGTYSC